MTISLNLSTAAIMQEIYATSALRCLNQGGAPRPAILTRDQGAALALLIKDAFAFIVMKIIPHVERCPTFDQSAGDDHSSDEILSIDLRLPRGVTASVTSAMCVALQHAIANYALHICYTQHNSKDSSHYLNIANTEVETLLQLLSTSNYTPVAIIPHY